MVINGVSVSMEVDTGATVSIISQAQQRTLLPDVTLHASSIHLKTYWGTHERHWRNYGECQS